MRSQKKKHGQNHPSWNIRTQYTKQNEITIHIEPEVIDTGFTDRIISIFRRSLQKVIWLIFQLFLGLVTLKENKLIYVAFQLMWKNAVHMRPNRIPVQVNRNVFD